MGDSARREISFQAELIVESIRTQRPDVIAAYSDGSFAREDMVRGSDVDIAFVVAGLSDMSKVHRRVFDGMLFEWAFIAQDEYLDCAAILKQAGFAHDIGSAKIWFDRDGFFSELQQRVRALLRDPGMARIRALDQLAQVEAWYGQFRKSLGEGQFHLAMMALSPIIKHAFAIPTALLNRPVTHCRAVLYCRRDSQEIGFSEYPSKVLKILGADGITGEAARDLLLSAYRIFDSCGLSEQDRQSYKAHLEISDYLVEINEPQASVWPIFFWTINAVKELRRDGKTEPSEAILDSLTPIQRELGILHPSELEARGQVIEGVLRMAGEILREMGEKACQ